MQSVKRNIQRFPLKFMFQLSEREYQTLRSQIATSNVEATRQMLEPSLKKKREIGFHVAETTARYMAKNRKLDSR
jgi:hypothetical protein